MTFHPHSNWTKAENLMTKGLQLEIQLFTNVSHTATLIIYFSEQRSLHRMEKSLFVKGVANFLALPANPDSFLLLYLILIPRESMTFSSFLGIGSLRWGDSSFLPIRYHDKPACSNCYLSLSWKLKPETFSACFLPEGWCLSAVLMTHMTLQNHNTITFLFMFL